MKALTSILSSTAVLSLLSLTNSQTNWHELECNNFEGEYGIDHCYRDFFDESQMFTCLSEGRLAEYTWNTTDCSGEPYETLYYGEDSTYSYDDYEHFQCNASSNCDFATLEDFDSGNNCAVSSRDWSWVEVLVDVCSSIDYSSQGFNSYMASCTSTLITLMEYKSDNCSGDPANTTYYRATGSWFDDEAIYCSSDGGYSECNSGEMTKYVANLIFVFVATLFFV